MHQQAAEAPAYYGGVMVKSYDRYRLSGRLVGMSYRESVKYTKESVRVRNLADFAVYRGAEFTASNHQT